MTVVMPAENTIEGKSLVDVLTLERKGSLWWEYARDVVKVVSHHIPLLRFQTSAPIFRRGPAAVGLEWLCCNADG